MSAVSAGAFTSKPDVTSGNGRFAVGKESQETVEGTVRTGKDRNKRSFLVHEVGRQTEAMALHAVSSAVGGGKVITYAQLVAAVAENGGLDKLAAEIEKARA